RCLRPARRGYGGGVAYGSGPDQREASRTAGGGRVDDPDPRQPHPGEAGPQGPHPGGRLRLRGPAGHPGLTRVPRRALAHGRWACSGPGTMAQPALALDPWDPASVAHPNPAYAELRERGRVHWFEPTNQWLVPHHADVSALLRDRRLGRTHLHRFTHEEFGRTPPPPEQEPFHTLNDHGMLDLEP